MSFRKMSFPRKVLIPDTRRSSRESSTVLITCGPTWVPIDKVRVISNLSTGEMGHLIAKAFRQRKAKVTVLAGPRSFDDFAKTLKKELRKKYDVVIHAAAVSDFKVAKPSRGKLSSGKPLTLKLVPTKKLINIIKQISPKSILVGFKLESDLKNARLRAESLFTQSKCDLVVANTLTGGYQALILDAGGRVLSKADSKKTLAQKLVNHLNTRC